MWSSQGATGGTLTEISRPTSVVDGSNGPCPVLPFLPRLAHQRRFSPLRCHDTPKWQPGLKTLPVFSPSWVGVTVGSKRYAHGPVPGRSPAGMGTLLRYSPLLPFRL